MQPAQCCESNIVPTSILFAGGNNVAQSTFLILFSTTSNNLIILYSVIYRVYKKKTEQIWNRSLRREAAQSMKFLINIDCVGTYDVE